MLPCTAASSAANYAASTALHMDRRPLLKSTGSDGWLIQSFPMCYNPSSYRLLARWIYDINNLENVPSGKSGYSTSWKRTCRDLACTFISTVKITITYAFIKCDCITSHEHTEARCMSLHRFDQFYENWYFAAMFIKYVGRIFFLTPSEVKRMFISNMQAVLLINKIN